MMVDGADRLDACTGVDEATSTREQSFFVLIKLHKRLYAGLGAVGQRQAGYPHNSVPCLRGMDTNMTQINMVAEWLARKSKD